MRTAEEIKEFIAQEEEELTDIHQKLNKLDLDANLSPQERHAMRIQLEKRAAECESSIMTMDMILDEDLDGEETEEK